MDQTDKRIRLIKELLDENRQYADIEIPDDPAEQTALLRGLRTDISPECKHQDILNKHEDSRLLIIKERKRNIEKKIPGLPFFKNKYSPIPATKLSKTANTIRGFSAIFIFAIITGICIPRCNPISTNAQ